MLLLECSLVTLVTSQREIDITKYGISFERCELPYFTTFILGKWS